MVKKGSIILLIFKSGVLPMALCPWYSYGTLDEFCMLYNY